MIASNLPAGRVLLFVVAGTYVLSAALLGFARWRGAAVAWWVLVGWVATGVAGMALAASLRPGRPAVWAGLLLALGPWMLFSLAYDVRERVWVMAALDVAGLLAIAWGLGMARAALR
ncbi:MAG TPA: hypothetical protein VF796_00955 [Humisphaera sp.]